MTEILSGTSGTVSMIDDVLIFKRSTTGISQALSRIKKAGLTLDAEKCEFSEASISF